MWHAWRGQYIVVIGELTYKFLRLTT